MSRNHPLDSSAPPTDADLAAVLGSAKPAFDALLSGVPGRIAEWRKYSSKSPWVLRVSQGRKPIMYVKPEPLALRTTVLLGHRAVEAALAGRVAKRLHRAIERAKVYPEGRPVEVRVTRVSDIERVEQLVAVKLRPEAAIRAGAAPLNVGAGVITGAAAERMSRAFIARFSPPDRARIRAARRLLRQQLGGAYELVYDNYNFFVIGYGPTERPSEAVVSLAAQANRLALCFLHGATLQDPHHVLRGSGRQVRNIPLDSAKDLERPEIQRLLKEAFARATAPLQRGPVRVIIRSVSAKQRPRR